MIALALIVLVSLVLLSARPAFACTTVLVGKDASLTGEVLVGHNEDSGGRYVMRTHLVPALDRPAGRKIRFEKNAAELTLPKERARLFWSEARPYFPDGGASFCDLYINGNGVVICSDNCGTPKEDKPELTDGGIGYGVRRLVAEQARSAYHAVEVAADLVGRYGYIGNGRSYHFADKNEIWVFQVVIGKNWAVKRLPDDEVYLNPNHFTIRTPDPETPGLEALLAYAEKRGWYDPASGQPFDFARAYQAPEGYRAVHNLHRHLRGLEVILGRKLDIEADLPFSVKPPRKIGVEDVKKVLRCHFEGTPDDVSAGETPHYMKTRPICAASTLESTVVQIRENHDMTLVRRALGRPCFAPFVPWYFGMSSVPEGYGTDDPEKAVETHFSVPPSDLDYAANDAGFRHTDLQAAADPLYRERGREVRAAVAELERAFDEELKRFELLAEAHFKTDAAKAKALLAGSVADWTGRALRRVGELYAAIKVLPVKGSDKIRAVEGESFSVFVPLGEIRPLWGEGFDGSTLVAGQTLFGMHCTSPSKRSPLEKAVVEGERLRLFFKVGEWAKAAVPCLVDLWLTLEDTQGRRLVGKGLIELETPPKKAGDCGDAKT